MVILALKILICLVLQLFSHQKRIQSLNTSHQTGRHSLTLNVKSTRTQFGQIRVQFYIKRQTKSINRINEP
jgi:uncharacterized membrane protein